MTKNIFPLILAIFFTTIIAFLIIKQIVYPTIIPMVTNGGATLFADWTVILNANNCLEKGYDVFVENPCDNWNRKHVYGEILLKLPFIKTFPKFYYFYFPIIINFLFLYVISLSIFNLKYKRLFPILLIFVFSLPVILVIERTNIDLIIFIFLFLISRYNNLILNYFLIIISSIVKIYPILISVTFFFLEGKKKILFNFFFVLILVFILFILQYENFIKIFSNKNQFIGIGYGLYEFSFIGFIEFINNLKINFKGTNYNWIKHFYIFLFIIIPIIITFYFNHSKINLIFSSSGLGLKNNFENRIYFLSSTIILVCYFTFSNFIYREIFFLGLIPALLYYKDATKHKILPFYFYILIIKFLLTSFLVFFYQNNIFLMFKPFMIVLKHTLDIYLISFVLRFYLNFLLELYRKIFY